MRYGVLERALDARNCIVAPRCPSNVSLQCSIMSVVLQKIPRPPRVPFYEDEFMEGKYLHRRYFLFPAVAKLHASHVALLYVVETTRACIFLNMLIYTITYSSCFFLPFFSPSPFFFYIEWRKELVGLVLPIISNFYVIRCRCFSRSSKHIKHFFFITVSKIVHLENNAFLAP